MKYIVTFEDYHLDAVSYVVDAPYMEYAISEAKDKAKEHGHDYCDGEVLSVMRI